jgi:hypothetical protein
MKSWLLAALAIWIFLALFIFWARTRLYYNLTRKYLEVRWLSLRVRRFSLGDIEYISKYQNSWAEHWENTWRPSHKRLVLHRRRGFMRDIVITPPFRYSFRRELEDSILAENPAAQENQIRASLAD